MDYLLHYKRLNDKIYIIDTGQLFSPKELTIKFERCEKTVLRIIEKLRLMEINVKCYKYEKILYRVNL